MEIAKMTKESKQNDENLIDSWFGNIENKKNEIHNKVYADVKDISTELKAIYNENYDLIINYLQKEKATQTLSNINVKEISIKNMKAAVKKTLENAGVEDPQTVTDDILMKIFGGEEILSCETPAVKLLQKFKATKVGPDTDIYALFCVNAHLEMMVVCEVSRMESDLPATKLFELVTKLSNVISDHTTDLKKYEVD